MREIKECTAEVFRRSEKRIKERKSMRNRILVLCIPVCLVMTAVSVWFFPKMKIHDETYGSAMDAAGDIGAAENFGDAFESASFEFGAFPYTVVELRSADPLPEHAEKVTDRAVVADLFDAIHSFFVDADMTFSDVIGDAQAGNEDFMAGEEPSSQWSAGSSGQQKAYTILFTADEGLQTMYRLDGNTLSNGNTNETVILNDAQVAELLIVFGISE